MAWFRKRIDAQDLGGYLGLLLVNQVCVVPDLWRHVYAEVYRMGTPLPDMTNDISSKLPAEAGALYSFVVWKFFEENPKAVSSMFDTFWAILRSPPDNLSFEDRPLFLPKRTVEQVKEFGEFCLSRVEEYARLAPSSSDVSHPHPTAPFASAILHNAFGLDDSLKYVMLSGEIASGVAIVWGVLERLQSQIKLR